MRRGAALGLLLVFTSPAVYSDTQAPLPGRKLTLAEVRQLARTNSPSILAARLQAEAARQRYAAAKALMYPQASAAAVGTVSSTEAMVASPTMLEPELMQMMPDGGGQAAALGVSAPIFTGGRLAAGTSAAAELFRAEEAAAEAVEIGAYSAAEIAFYKLEYTAALVQAAEAEVSEQQEQTRVAGALLETGKAPEYYVTRAQSELARAQKQLLIAQAERLASAADLAAAIGEEPAVLEVSSPSPVLDVPDLAQLVQRIDQSPLLRSRRAGSSAAIAETSQARADFLPQVYAIARYDARSANDSDAMVGSGYTIGITVSLPLLDGGLRRARLGEAVARQKASDATLEQERLRLLAQLHAEHSRAGALREGVDLSRQTLESARQNYDVALARYEAGRGVQVEVLDALASLAQARREVAESIFESNSAVTRLLATAAAL